MNISSRVLLSFIGVAANICSIIPSLAYDNFALWLDVYNISGDVVYLIYLSPVGPDP